MQQKIQKAQDSYGRLLELQKELAQSLKYWEEATKLVQELEEFYHQPTWLDLHYSSQKYTLDTKGNYSVLSEDAIWNALWEQRNLEEKLVEIIKPILDRIKDEA
ncbi:DUF4298 domain-containing protein [Rodentibacter pneumotropicus]|uniref:DUF4298 domain-containing protein n=1 Tax=Rodentibacter pneumotropicus TaxID=758 RepID=UPI000986C853|nr:DUF4298 domain-containing protein [Rodentibacter pneumotropicus]OOF62066.1 hypothetical protein BKL50_06725 [Rodentibacter pneumotropicus]THA18305.1 DUF4298 domain-containing protein [Rodentibacter pneumotropicus]